MRWRRIYLVESMEGLGETQDDEAGSPREEVRAGGSEKMGTVVCHGGFERPHKCVTASRL